MDTRDLPSLTLRPAEVDDLELVLLGALQCLPEPLGGDPSAPPGDGAGWTESPPADGRGDDGDPPGPRVRLVRGIDEVVRPGERVVLRDEEGVALGLLTVARLAKREGADKRGAPDRHELAGHLSPLARPVHHDAVDLRRSPAEVQAQVRAQQQPWLAVPVVGLPTTNAVSAARSAADERGLSVLLLGRVGAGTDREGGADRATRVAAWRAVLPAYGADAQLVVLTDRRRVGGLPPTIWTQIATAYGAVGLAAAGRPHPSPAAPPDLAMVPLPDDAPDRARLRDLLDADVELPDDLVPPAVAEVLRRRWRPRHRQGVTILFTGLSGSGKSTVAQVLAARLQEQDARTVTLLDGDLVRQHLSSELGFSRAHRDLNVRRIGFVAAEITRAGGIAIAAPIAPYDATRRVVRAQVEDAGGFLLVHVATPLEVCERRDRKGLYAKARAGLIPEFTGVSDPYEEPADADLVIDTTVTAAADAAEQVLATLRDRGWLSAGAAADGGSSRHTWV